MLSAIILRQTLPQGDTVLFLKLSEELQARIKIELLGAITSEPERYVRSQISDTVASLASVLLYKNRWPELFPALYSMCEPSQTREPLKVCALGILGKLSDAADNLLPQVALLHAVFVSTLAPSNSLVVREAACVACCKIIPILEKKEHTAEFRKFISLFLGALGDALTAEDEDAAKHILAGLTEVATEEGKFFEKDLDKIIPAMYAIGADTQNRGLDEGVRQYACEVLIGMAESLPPMIRKSPTFIKHTILVCMSLMLCVEEDPMWGQKQDSTDFYDNSSALLTQHTHSLRSLHTSPSSAPVFALQHLTVSFFLCLCDVVRVFSSNFDCGEMNLDRLALCVKGTKLWPVLKPILDQFVSDQGNWRMRHAGLFALAQTCAVIAFESLPVREICAMCVRDPHPRVRYAAVQCLGQFPVDFEVVTQSKWHKQMYPALMEPLKDFAHPRLQMHAASALLNMVDGSEPKILKHYMAQMMSLLVALLKQSKQMVQEQVMPVMAALAGQASAQFLPYYDEVVPLLKHIILHAHTRETRKLRAKAMESVSFIGMYCGKDKFHADAKEIMQMFLTIMQQAAVTSSAAKARKGQQAAAGAAAPTPQQQQADMLDSNEDDYSEQHMLQAWTRICTCLGEEFVPVLPYVMPQVFELITRKSESEISAQSQRHRIAQDGEGGDADAEDGSGGFRDEEDEDANVAKDGTVKSISATGEAAAGSSELSIGEKPSVLLYTSHAHTAAMEDKAMALSMLCSFCHDLKDGFLPFVKQSAEIMIPLLEHPHEEVQAHAIQGMPHLFRSAVEAHKKGTASLPFCKVLLEAIVDQLCAVFPTEGDAQTLQTMVVSLHECLDEAGPLVREVVDGPNLHKVGEALLRLLHESHRRMALREELLKKEDEDGDLDEERIVEIESRNAGEDGLNSVVASCVESLIKSHQEAFLPVFDALFPEIQRMLSVNSLPSTRKIAIFIVDDVIEHLGSKGAAKYFPNVLEAMCIYACDINEEHGLRQAAAFGVGLAAKHGGAAFAPFKAEIVARFVAAIKADPTYLARAPADPVGMEFVPASEEDEGAAGGGAGAAAAGEDEEEEEEEGAEDEGEDDEEDDYDERSRHCALDNMVSALGSIAVYQSEPTLLPLWLSFLPLHQDESEATAVYHMLLTLIEQNNPAILGDNYANLPKILSILLVLINTNMLKNKELRKRVKGFFQTVKAMPAPLLQEVGKALVPTLQQKLAGVLQGV